MTAHSMMDSTAELTAETPSFRTSGEGAGTRAKVLLADDDQDTRVVLRCVLEDEGYQVVEATDGRDALATLARSGEPMVALLDQRMPGLLGTDVLDAVLRMRGAVTGRRFVLMTASPHLLPKPYAHPWFQRVVPVLGKPFDLGPLLSVIASASSSLVRPPSAP